MSEKWFEHDGGGCPVARGTMLEVERADGSHEVGPAQAPADNDLRNAWVWAFCHLGGRPEGCIIRYRYIRDGDAWWKVKSRVREEA